MTQRQRKVVIREVRSGTCKKFSASMGKEGKELEGGPRQGVHSSGSGKEHDEPLCAISCTRSRRSLNKLIEYCKDISLSAYVVNPQSDELTFVQKM